MSGWKSWAGVFFFSLFIVAYFYIPYTLASYTLRELIEEERELEVKLAESGPTHRYPEFSPSEVWVFPNTSIVVVVEGVPIIWIALLNDSSTLLNISGEELWIKLDGKLRISLAGSRAGEEYTVVALVKSSYFPKLKIHITQDYQKVKNTIKELHKGDLWIQASLIAIAVAVLFIALSYALASKVRDEELEDALGATLFFSLVFSMFSFIIWGLIIFTIL